MSKTIAVIGNPNCGKTTLFNALTGSKQKVGNWPGVTVEKKEGQFVCHEETLSLIDLPGTYSIDVYDDKTSLDEKIARDYIVSKQADLVINILDASNLERNLFLTAQLLEMQQPMLVVLNMMDVAKRNGIEIEPAALSEQLGCPVIAIIASDKTGLLELKHAISTQLTKKHISSCLPTYSSQVEQALGEISKFEPRFSTYSRAEQIGVLERVIGDKDFRAASNNDYYDAIACEFNKDNSFNMAVNLADARYQLAEKLAKFCQKSSLHASETLSEMIDKVVLNRIFGIPIFLAIMYLMFTVAVNVGGAFIDFFDIATGALLVDGFGQILASINTPAWLITLLADGLGGGIQLVATFIPVIGFLYLCLAFIEDSGYMARAAFIMDRLMRTIGLPGKSFVPLIVGFGCNVPAVMASRTLETHKDRLLTIAMAPFMSCGARLSVYALFVAAFFESNGQNIVFALYLIGIVMAILTGLVLKKTLFSPNLTPFIMELPAYHLPTLRGVVFKAWERLSGFCMRAGKTIIIVFVVLKVLSSLGTDGSFGNDNTDKSMLSVISKAVTPVFHPIGIEQDNWPATVGVFTGVFAKEAVVGTLDSLYSSLNQAKTDEVKETIVQQLMNAVSSIGTNLSNVMENLLDPLGLSQTMITDKTQAASDQAVNISTYDAMASLFSSKIAAFSYLLFILLYTPCVAVMGAVYREAGLKWMLFVAGWSTGLAYITASVTYQIGTFASQPVFASFWLAGCAVITFAAILTMKIYGYYAQKNSLLIPVVNII